MIDRRIVLGFLSDLENKQRVYSMKYNDLDLWPIIKFVLFFSWHDRMNPNERSGRPKTLIKLSLVKIIQRFYDIIEIVKFVMLKKTKVDFLLLGADHFNTVQKENNLSVNKYFLPFRRNYTTSKIIEINYSSYRTSLISEKIIYTNSLLLLGKLYSKKSGNLQILSDPYFLSIIREFSILTGFEESFYLSKIKEKLNSIELYIAVFNRIVQKFRPTVIRELCYYNTPLFALNYLANKYDIQIADMQHGGVGADHPMYNFKNLNTKLNTIPKSFIVWDEVTHDYLVSIFSSNCGYSIKNEGNLWLNYIIESDTYKISGSKIILYTMQYPYFEDSIIESIRETRSDYKWWIRMHPRYQSRKKELISQLKNEGLLEKVEFDNSNKLPLPILLQKSTVHISAFSGSIIEASIIGVPSIIISETGLRMYKEYIESKRAVYLDNNKIKLTTLINKILHGELDICYNARIQ